MSNTQQYRTRSSLPEAFGIVGRDMDELFDRLFLPQGNGHKPQWSAPMAVWEEGEQFHIEVELPGVSDENLDVTFEKNQLKIVASREAASTESRKYLHNERLFGEVTRVVNIPESVDAESIQAEFKAGLLHIELSKKPELKPRKIDVKSN